MSTHIIVVSQLDYKMILGGFVTATLLGTFSTLVTVLGWPYSQFVVMCAAGITRPITVNVWMGRQAGVAAVC